ncbi:MAG: hypothetical protein HN712_20785 [Gemmatimonadetes bacterium]|jgi:hypothetical protein|nr:hypothetical protein [Gemmatimonadota bacterium]MBT7862763.1 hypothetical protein [Gemmatimonadota bacterium]
MTAAEVRSAIAAATSPDDKAAAIETMLWDFGRSPENLIYCFTMGDTFDRVRIGDVASGAPDPDKLTPDDLKYASETLTVRWQGDTPQYLMQGLPLEDCEAYEDSMLGTGQILSAFVFQYLATMNEAVLEKAGIAFAALESVYKLGLQEEPGWLPKPYGFTCSGQSSMDNQCPYYLGLLRYYRIAPPDHQDRIRRILADEMDYWIRHRYAMHRDYFGLMVDYKTEKFYPGHWPLLFLPLCHGVWRITGDDRYRQEYAWLLDRLDLAPGKDPEYLRKDIRCLHRWFYQFGSLLEIGAEPRSLFLEGLRYQVAAIVGADTDSPTSLYDVPHHAWIWLEPHDEALRVDALEQLMAQTVESFLYRWPSYRYGPMLDWRERAMYCYKTTNWLEMFWKGRWRGDW